jgi:hypothetical protein
MRFCRRHEIHLFAIIAPWNHAKSSFHKGVKSAGVPDKFAADLFQR